MNVLKSGGKKPKNSNNRKTDVTLSSLIKVLFYISVKPGAFWNIWIYTVLVVVELWKQTLPENEFIIDFIRFIIIIIYKMTEILSLVLDPCGVAALTNRSKCGCFYS